MEVLRSSSIWHFRLASASRDRSVSAARDCRPQTRLRCDVVPDSAVAGPSLILLVRHGATEWSESGQHTGRTDLPLIDKGRRQADRLPPLLATLSDGALPLVFTSPLQRARETARRAVPGVQATEVDALVEYDYGDYEGLTSGGDRRDPSRMGAVQGRLSRGREPPSGDRPVRRIHRQTRADGRRSHCNRVHPRPSQPPADDAASRPGPPGWGRLAERCRLRRDHLRQARSLCDHRMEHSRSMSDGVPPHPQRRRQGR